MSGCFHVEILSFLYSFVSVVCYLHDYKQIFYFVFHTQLTSGLFQTFYWQHVLAPTVPSSSCGSTFNSLYYLRITYLNCTKVVNKGKVVPLCSIESLLGERRYSSYTFFTSALEGGVVSIMPQQRL
jgi:hypothetical protein